MLVLPPLLWCWLPLVLLLAADVQSVKNHLFSRSDHTGHNRSTEATGGPGAAARQVVALQQELRACADRLPAGSDLLERVTLELSTSFLNYSAWDTVHADTLAGYWAAWHSRGTHPSASDEDAAKRLPGIELRESAAALRRAIVTCKSQCMIRPTTDSACAQRLVIDRDAGFFAREAATAGQRHRQQRFAFPCGYNFQPETPLATDCNVLGVNIADISIGVSMLEPATLTVPNETVHRLVQKLSALHASGIRASIFLSHAAMPVWAEAKFRGINPVRPTGHFFNYDIDHPAARVLWAALFNSLLPQIGSHPAIYGYLLANEPEFPSFEGQYVYAKLHQWLIRKYNATEPYNVSLLNSAWGSHWNSFDAVANLTFAPSQWATWRPNNVSVQQWVDMDAFNKWRVTDFFTFLHDSIHDAVNRQQPPHQQQRMISDCHVKVSNAGHPWGSLPAAGIDRLALMDLTELNGCDTRMWPSDETHLPFPQHLRGTYALDWVPLSAAYDFQRSVAPSKPLLDSEWHSLSTVHFRMENAPVSHHYLGSALWLARLHGQAGLEMWYWGRKSDGAAFSGGKPSVMDRSSGSWFPYSLSAEAAQFDSFLRAHASTNSVADTIVAAANTPREVWILHSPLSALMDGDASGWELATYTVAHGLGVNLGWLPTRALPSLAAGLPVNVSGGGRTLRSLLVPCTSHIDDEGFIALRTIHSRKHPSLLLVGNSSCGQTALRRDSLGQLREADAMTWLGSVARVDIGDVADEKAMQAMEAAIQQVLSPPLSRTIRCAGPDDSKVGIFCRSVALHTQSTSPVSYFAVFVMNLLNVTTTISLTTQAGQQLHANASTLVFGSSFGLGENDKLQLEPLELVALNVSVFTAV